MERSTRSGLLLATLVLGSACSLVTGSGKLDFSREREGDGDESGGSSGDGDGMGGETSGGSPGDGDGDQLGGSSSGGTSSGGGSTGGDGSGGSDPVAFTGVDYTFDTDLEGWDLEPDSLGWGSAPDPYVEGAVMKAELNCDAQPCEAVFFVPLDPPAPAEGLQLFAGLDIEGAAAPEFNCQFGFWCSSPMEWKWSAEFVCDDLVAGINEWELHRDANAECSIERFGIKVSSIQAESVVFALDYLSLHPPE